MSIVNVVSSRQVVGNRGIPQSKKADKEKPATTEQPAVAVSVSGSGVSKQASEAQSLKREADTKLDNEIDARAFMDSTKAGMLADAGATIMAQSQQNAERVSELIS